MNVDNAIYRVQKQKMRALDAVIEANFTEMGRECWELREEAEANEEAFWREYFIWYNSQLRSSGKSDTKEFVMWARSAELSWYKVWHNAMDRYIATTKSEGHISSREERIRSGENLNGRF